MRTLIGLCIVSCLVAACGHKSYHDFEQGTPAVQRVAVGAGFIPLTQNQSALEQALIDDGVQIVRYGDRLTMIIPTDKIYLFGSTELNQYQYRLLNTLAFYLAREQVLNLQLAAFTDEVGSKRDKRKLTQGRAQTMMTFLWANGIPLETMTAKGYGDRYDTASNASVFGSQMNRRLEIQWQVSEFDVPVV